MSKGKKESGSIPYSAKNIHLLMALTPLSSEESPWKVLESEVKLSTPWIDVTLHKVLNPAGKEGIYGVTSFKNLAIGILPIDEEDNTYLVGQYRFPMNKYSWEIPEGGGPIGISPLLSAQRELKEETGIEADNWELIQSMELSNSATDEVAHIFLATGLSYGESSPEENEQINLFKIPFAELYERVKSAEITDSLTVAAVLKYRIMQLDGSLHHA